MYYVSGQLKLQNVATNSTEHAIKRSTVQVRTCVQISKTLQNAHMY